MTQKHLSYSAILVLAANTMNGPGITTLPDVAVDAGILLYIALIVLSVRMASFVCKRMVFAMWSSCGTNEESAARKGYERVESVECHDTTTTTSLIEKEDEDRIHTDSNTISTIQLTELHPNQRLEHREYVVHKSIGDPQSKMLDSEEESLLDHGHVSDIRPVLERTSIVGQSLEGYGRSTGTMVALTMVASALW